MHAFHVHPMRSQRLEISFMNEILNASMALAAYSGPAPPPLMPMNRRRSWVRMNGAYKSCMTCRLLAVRADDDAVRLHEILDRRAFLQNSGLLTTSTGISRPRLPSSSRMAARTLSAVPTGTVDLSTMIL